MLKICTRCKIEQDISNFGLLKSSKDGHRCDCKHCRKEYRSANKEVIQKQQKDFYNSNKESLLEKNKLYREKNILAINEQRKEYRSRPEIQEHVKLKNKEYLPIRKQKIKELRKTDVNFQLSEILRSKIHKMIHGKTTSYQTIIGCDIIFLKKWLEFRFDTHMNWQNLGTYWQIDHILPINAFNFLKTSEINVCFHWTNLQPLITYENQSKSDNLQMHYYFNNIVNVCRFNLKYKNFEGYQAVNESLQWLRNKELRYGKNPTNDLAIANEMDNPQPSS